MSRTTTSSGTPIPALPLASSVSVTDTVIGVVTSGGVTAAAKFAVSAEQGGQAATDTEPAVLTPDIPLDDATKIGSTGKTLSDVLARADQLPSGTYYVDQNDVVRLARQVGELPDDVSLNGNVYMAGATALPTGLTSNGGVIMTDGTIYFPNTWNNNGVLCAAGA